LVAAITRASIAHFVVRADGTHLSFLQNAQQFDLHRGRHFADFVEKNRAFVAASNKPLRLAFAPVNEPLT
jgi:hypothetical protein